MLRVTLRGIQDHVVRLLLTACAVMLGVSFVTGTFVLRDSIDATLSGLLGQAAKGVDVSVRGVEARTGTGSATAARSSVPLSLVGSLAGLPGVARVSPDLEGNAVIAGRDGTAVRNGGAPNLGFAFSATDDSFTLTSGRGPTSSSEVAVESATLAKSGLHVGDTTRAVIGGQVRRVTITGVVHFGYLFGATAVLVDPATARAVYAPDGTVPSISVTADRGVSQSQLRRTVAATLPVNSEAVTGATVRSETGDAVAKGLGFFTTFLLVFAAVALFVGAFIIVNTFSMLIGQRARELALLRALGASTRQVTGLVLGEALAIGLVGSALGIGLGILVAQGAKTAVRSLLGADIGAGLPITATTILLSVAVGVLVTVAAAVLPARRAARTAPVAAMRGDTPIAQGGLRLRGSIGAALVTVGTATLALSVTRPTVSWTVAGGGALLSVLGLLVAAPWVTRPVVRMIASPFVAVAGVPARLARQNAIRVPRRTAATASALMIGLALVAGISVLAQSVKASVTEGVSNELRSDYVLSAGTLPLPTTLASAARAAPGVRSVAAISQVPVRIGSFSTNAAATTASAAADNFKVSMTSGRLDAMHGDVVLVDATTARAHGWQVGDVLSATVGTLADHPVSVGGIYEDSQAFGSHLIIDSGLYRTAVPAGQQFDARLFVRADAGADPETVRSSLVGLAKPYLVVSVQDGAEFAKAEGASVNTLLDLLYVLLLFSVVIAVLGIVNTLALSVLERTREIGLLRAVGLARRQLAGMITVEAIATAVFGAVLGTVLGLGLGVALQHGLRSQGLSTLAIPWTLVLVLLVASVVVGVLAAALPSIRAVRLNILEAIASA